MAKTEHVYYLADLNTILTLPIEPTEPAETYKLSVSYLGSRYLRVSNFVVYLGEL